MITDAELKELLTLQRSVDDKKRYLDGLRMTNVYGQDPEARVRLDMTVRQAERDFLEAYSAYDALACSITARGEGEKLQTWGLQ